MNKTEIFDSKCRSENRLTYDRNVRRIGQMQKYCQARVMRCLYFLKIINRYSPYCPHCSSCGETECCSPTGCINHPKGHYCETNQDALKVSYWTLKEFWNNYFEEQSKKEDYNLPHLWTKKQILKEVDEALSEIYTKNYAEQREYRMSLPERQSFFEKIKSLIRKRSVK